MEKIFYWLKIPLSLSLVHLFVFQYSEVLYWRSIAGYYKSGYESFFYHNTNILAGTFSWGSAFSFFYVQVLDLPSLWFLERLGINTPIPFSINSIGFIAGTIQWFLIGLLVTLLIIKMKNRKNKIHRV